MAFKDYLIAYFLGQLKVISRGMPLERKPVQPVITNTGVASLSVPPKICSDYIREKNSAWFRDSERHVENARKHFAKEKKTLHRDYREDELLREYGSFSSGPVFSGGLIGDFYVPDHGRSGHYRNTKDGIVWVRPHTVRGHKKRR